MEVRAQQINSLDCGQLKILALIKPLDKSWLGPVAVGPHRPHLLLKNSESESEFEIYFDDNPELVRSLDMRAQHSIAQSPARLIEFYPRTGLDPPGAAPRTFPVMR